MIHIIAKDGERQQVSSLDGYEGWTVLASVPDRDCGTIADHEAWDDGAGTMVVDEEAAADDEAGREAIRFMHGVKQAEAAMILSGVELTRGMVVEEANTLGIAPLVLAQRIFDRAAPERASEIARRWRKEAWRAARGRA